MKGLSFEPEIFPTANGSIQLEWEDEEGNYLEFEIFGDYRIKKFFCSSQNQHDSCYIPESEINPIIADFFAKVPPQPRV